MSQNLDLKAQIEYVLKEQGITDAIARFKELEAAENKAGKAGEDAGNKIEGAGKKIKGAGDEAEGFGRKLTTWIGGAAIGAFYLDAIKGSEQFARGLNAIKIQLEGLGQAADTGRVEQFLRNLEETGRGMTSETVPAMQRLIGSTKDVDAAMRLVSAASTFATAGLGQLNDVSMALSGILSGESLEAAKKFGVALDATNNFGKDAAKVLEQVLARADQLSTAQKGVGSSADQMAGKFAAAKKSVGEAYGFVAGYVAIVADKTIKAIQIIGEFLGTLVASASDTFANLGGMAASAFDFKTLFTDPSAYLSNVKGSLTKFGDDMGLYWQGFGDRISKIWTASTQAAVIKVEEADKKLVKLTTDAVNAKNAGLIAAEAERLRQEAAMREQARRDEAAADAAAREKLLSAQLANVKSGTQEELDLKVRLLQAARDRELTESKATAEGLMAIWQAYEEQKFALVSAYLTARTEAETQAALDVAAFRAEMDQGAIDFALGLQTDSIEARRQLQDNAIEDQYEADLKAAGNSTEKALAAYQKYEKNRGALSKARATEDKKLAQEQMVANAELYAGVANTALGAFATIFGNSKATAIAQAIINTYEGATKALAQGGVAGPALAALVIAAGMAQVAKIKSAKPGAGFDDPKNDALAYVGGRRWANDLIRHINAGFYGRMAEAASPFRSGDSVSTETTYDYSGKSEYHFHGPVVGGRGGMIELSRDVERARRLDRTRKVR